MEVDMIKIQKKNYAKAGQKLLKSKQCKKQKLMNATMMLLVSSQMEQEQIIKKRKLERTSKIAGIMSKQTTQDIASNKIINEDDQDQDIIHFNEEKVHYMEEDEDEQQIMQVHNIQSRVDDIDHYCDRQQSYDAVYGVNEDINLLQGEIDLFDCLKNHNIAPLLRSKMIDWMVEVFANYREICSDKTYFRAVGLLDLFYKKNSKRLHDSDVHLYGVAAMFLASKSEDSSHISLEDIIHKVSHNKFTEMKIREAEYEILRTVGMIIDFPTPYTYLCRYLYKIFQNKTSQMATVIQQQSVKILKKCLHDEEFLKYNAHILAFSAFIVAIKLTFQSMKGENLSVEQFDLLQNEEMNIIEQIFQLIPDDEHKYTEYCSISVYDLYFNFSKQYPDLKNLERFSF